MSFTKGDYVLATKYEDGDPRDHWCVGFYLSPTWHGRHNIVDGDGKLFRHNGFRRVHKIPAVLGKWLLDHKEDVYLSESVWDHVPA